MIKPSRQQNDWSWDQKQGLPNVEGEWELGQGTNQQGASESQVKLVITTNHRVTSGEWESGEASNHKQP